MFSRRVACSRPPRQSRGLVLAACTLAACGGSAPPQKSVAHHTPELPPEDFGPARFVILPPEGPSPLLEEDPGGARRFVTFGMRVLEDPDGGLTHASELLLDVEELGAVRLPDRLGGGYLFVGQDDGETLVWKSKAWTSRLVPLVRLPFETDAIAPGFDRIYAVARRKGLVVAFHGESGELLRPEPLPPSPAYGAMAFADGWLAAVETDVRGPLVTFDAGATWHPLELLTHSPAVVPGADGTLVINTSRGRFALDASGRLTKLERGGDTTLSDALGLGDIAPLTDSIADEEAPPKPTGTHPLRRAVLHGVPIGDGQVLVASARGHERIRLSDGRVVHSHGVVDPFRPCHGVPIGNRAAFVCTEGSQTTLVGVGAGDRQSVIQRFDGTRFVASSGNGHLVVRGGCHRPEPGRYCIVNPRGVTREIQVTGDVGVERLVALSDGRVAVIVPPRFGVAPTLTIVDAGGSTSTKVLDLTSAQEGAKTLLESGLWLDGPVEPKPGVIGLWVAGGGALAGVAIDVKRATVTAGSVREGLETTSFAGARALSLTPGNALFETLDGGTTWSEVPLPGRLAESMRAESGGGEASARERGCSRVGCVLGDWVRLGWGASDANTLEEAPRPSRTAAPDASFVSWALRCAPSGRVSRRVLGQAPAALRESTRLDRVSRARVGGAGGVDEAQLESSAFRPFLGYAPPVVSPGELAFDFGTEDLLVQARGYVWGPRGAAWDRQGRWVVRSVDRFAVDSVWTTGVSRSPWADALTAAARFGSDPSHRTVTEWQVHTDASGERGLLAIRVQGAVELFAIAKDRPISPIADPDGLGLEHPTGVVVVNDELYVGSVPSSRAFRIAKIESGVLRLVGTYPRYAEAPPPRLVRGTSHNALGIMSAVAGHLGPRGGDGGWYVFPVDGRTGQASPPVTVPHGDLLRLPRPCGPDDDGWLVEHTLSRSIARVDLADSGQGLPTTDVEMRLVVQEHDVCVSAVATSVAGGPLDDTKLSQTSAGEPRPISLVITDRATDRRFGFRCSG